MNCKKECGFFWGVVPLVLQEESRVLFQASYYNLAVLEQVFIPRKYIKLSLNHPSAKKLTDLIKIYRKLSRLIYKNKNDPYSRQVKQNTSDACTLHAGEFLHQENCNSNLATVGVHGKVDISLLGITGVNRP